MTRLIFLCGVLWLLASCDNANNQAYGNDANDDASFQQWKLPGKLREVSGLALTGDERLLAVTDEEAIVYEIDYETGSLVKAFALGDPTLRGDFEGIAVVDEHVWLMTSSGRLLQTLEGADGERMSFAEFDTNIGDYCEFEGMAATPGQQELLLACKEARANKNEPVIFRVSVAGGQASVTGRIELVEQRLAASIDKKQVKPSGLAIDPESAARVLLVAQHHALIYLDRDGAPIKGIILPGKGRHRQPEGIEITRDGRLLIADEGGDGAARLAVYDVNGVVGQPE